MTHKDEFRERAKDARQQAEATNLDNVRDQLLRSAAAWEVMAQREERVSAAREARAQAKQIEVDQVATADAATPEIPGSAATQAA